MRMTSGILSRTLTVSSGFRNRSIRTGSRRNTTILIFFTVFFLASVTSIGQESASRAKAERVNAAIKELAEGAQPAQRVQAAGLLGQSGDRKATRPLLALPHDKEHQACISIALALGQLKSEKAIKPLLDGLNDANPDVCRNSSIALVLIGGKGQVGPLITALQSLQPVVRRSAVFALGLFGDRKATLPLVALLHDGDVTVRLNTVEALGRLKDPRSGEPLRGVAQSDSDSSVREGARSALAKVLPPPPAPRERSSNPSRSRRDRS